MNNDAFQERLRKVFLVELEEHLQALERDLLALEQSDIDGRKRLVDELFRTAHTLKGASRAVNFMLLERVAHLLESVFEQMRLGKFRFRPEMLGALLRVLDALTGAWAAHAAGANVLDAETGPVGNVLPLLAALETGDVEQVSRLMHGAPVPDGSLPALTGNDAVVASGMAFGDAESPKPAFRERRRDRTVRMNNTRLQHMMALGGEMLVARQRLARRQRLLERALDQAPVPRADTTLLTWLREMRGHLSGLAADRRALEQVAEPLADHVMRVGMAPFAEACQGFDRIVRDLLSDTGKQASLSIEGGDIEMDRAIVESIRDPLLHLVRNAVAHGIEAPAVRANAGKQPAGLISVSADLSHGGIHVCVRDDGAGLDLQAIRAGNAIDSRHLSDTEIIDTIFAPGFSTRSQVSPLAGRGVGLDVVRETLTRLRGSVVVDNQPGRGVAFHIQLPLSLSVISALLVRAQGQVLAFDVRSVERVLRILPDDIITVDDHEAIFLDGHSVRVNALGQALYGAQGRPPDAGTGGFHAVLLSDGERRVVLLVDELLAEQPVAVRGLGARVRKQDLVAGATLLPSGTLALVLNVMALVRRVGSTPSSGRLAPAPVAAGKSRQKILVAEDSLTTRTLMQGILEMEHYAVITSRDGLEAWQRLQREPVDLIVSDVEMPAMDGFALTEAVRKSSHLAQLPVILVTALKNDQDRLRGMQAGANAYLVKSSFDQSELLSVIRQLI